MVKIKVRVDSKVDMKNHRNIAVIDFIDIRDSSITEQGKILARMIRKQLKVSREFNILDERAVDLTLLEDMDKDKIESPDALVSVSSQLGADTLIIGTFDFYQLNQAVPYVVQRYSSRTGRYTPETRTYVQRVNRLSLHAKVVDGATGETIFDYAPPSEERPELHNAWGLPFSGSRDDPEVLRTIAGRPIRKFVLSLIPHYEYERRTLVR